MPGTAAASAPMTVPAHAGSSAFAVVRTLKEKTATAISQLTPIAADQ